MKLRQKKLNFEIQNIALPNKNGMALAKREKRCIKTFQTSVFEIKHFIMAMQKAIHTGADKMIL